MNKDSNTNSTSAALASYKAKIDQTTTKAMNVFLANYKNLGISKDSLEALKVLVEFANGPGKRIRGVLAWYTYEQMCAEPQEATGANLAVAIELIQDYLLILDDVMDKSNKRRGNPTVHEIYNKKLSSLSANDRKHLANMMAVNIGCLAQHFANELMLQCSADEKYISRAQKILHENIVLTCFGQIDDLTNSHSGLIPNKALINSIYEAKSSYYTFINPIQMGVALAGYYDNKLMQEVIDFGKPAGLAFQLQDDILGMFGDSKTTGKPNLDDLREGKRTLLILYALEMADAKSQAIIKEHLGNLSLTEKDYFEVRDIIEKCGAKTRVEQEAKKIAKQAIDILRKSSFKPELKDFYSSIIRYSVDRKW